MSKQKGQQRSRLATVLRFFREGHPDEIRAVFHILAEERLLPEPPRSRRPRANGAPVAQADGTGA